MNEFYDCCKYALILHASEKELVGKGVILSDGKAGTIDHVFVDDIHGLRIGPRSVDRSPDHARSRRLRNVGFWDSDSRDQRDLRL
ncbi:hypothetical protein PMN64_18065 [Bradyrhizobium sp. UFLA01-814]|uniref:hypothetical protein n=1 Tax=Bradyrhizobium sp. UFLA01-814 TaxID=3023480 RepID=UPI00398A684E